MYSLGPLSKRVKEAQLQDILDTLCNHLLNDKKGADELRDISSIGLRTVIFELPAEPVTIPQLLIKRLTPRLITGISNVKNPFHSFPLFLLHPIPLYSCLHSFYYSLLTLTLLDTLQSTYLQVVGRQARHCVLLFGVYE